jgi:hypothetical protein
LFTGLVEFWSEIRTFKRGNISRNAWRENRFGNFGCLIKEEFIVLVLIIGVSDGPS